MFSRNRSVLSMLCLEERNVPAAGDLDTTFGTGGKVTIPFDIGGNDDRGESIRIQPDGKIIVAGFATFDATSYDFAVTRLNADGSLDSSFGSGGKTTVTVRQGGQSDDEVVGLALQGDGKIVLVGNAVKPSGDTDFSVVRLNNDGSLDTTFNGSGKLTVPFDIGGNFEDQARSVAIDSNGKIVVAGYSQVNSNATDVSIARINSDGSLDSTFDGDGRQTIAYDIGGAGRDKGYSVAVQADGRIVIGGLAQITGQDFDFAFARLNANGSLDTSFAGDGRQTVAFNVLGTVDDRGRSLLVQSDGKIVMGGVVGIDSPDAAFGVTRLNANGTLDTTFGENGIQTVEFNVGGGLDDRLRQVILQPDGKLVLVGHAQVSDTDYDFAVARLTSGGTLDTTFGTGGMKTLSFNIGGNLEDRGRGIAIQPDGKLVVAGYAEITTGLHDFAVARLEGVTAGPPVIPPGTSPPPGTVPPGTSPTTPPVTLPPGQVLLAFTVGPGPGLGSTIVVYGSTGNEAFRIDPFGGFTGGVRVSTADVNNDGIPDVIAGTGPGIATSVKVINGSTRAQVYSFTPFESAFVGGVYVASGDITGDGFADIAISPDEGGGPRIRLFDGRTGDPLADFFGIDDPNFRGGARVSIADVNGDGTGDLLVAAGFGGGPRLAVFDGKTVRNGQTPVKLFADFFVFEETLRNGIFIAGGDLTGDGKAEVIAGGGPGGGPRVFALSGSDLLTGKQTQVANFFAGNDSNRGGVRIAARNLDGDSKLEVVTGSGPVTTSGGSASRVTTYAGNTIGAATPSGGVNIEPFGSFINGVFVG